jgi:predicted permease
VSTIAVDARVLIASIGAGVLCGLLAGGAPAWRLSHSQLFAQMKVGGGVIGGRRQAQALGAFLVAEVAFVTVLLVATTLVVTSFVLVTTADLRFNRHDAITIDVSRSVQSVPKNDRQAAGSAFFADVLDRARAVPGVKSAGLIAGGTAPLGGGSTRYSLVIPGVGEVKGEDGFETRGVSPEYFSAMGLRLLRGRSFEASDRAGAPAVAIINDLAARRYFPTRDPIGQVVTFREDTRIVGVVQNVRFHGPEADWHSELYVPVAQEPQPFDTLRAQLVIRTTGSAPATASAVREAIRPAMSGAAVPEPRFVDDAFRRLTADRRFNAGLMTIFGVVAVAIGCIGIYGTMTFVVAQQARAIGLRMALGASPSNVLRSILRESLWRVGVGVALGLIGARAVASLFTSLVFGVQATSLAVYAAVAIGLASVGVIAALVPARRAAQLDPLAALRAE